MSNDSSSGLPISRASIFSILDQAVSLLFSFLLLILIARHLGVENLGLYQFAMSVVALVLVVTNFGLSAIANREIARSSTKLRLYLGSALSIRLLISLPLTVVLTFATMQVIGDKAGSDIVVLLAVFYSAFLSNVLLINGVLFSLQKVRQVLIINSAYKILAIILVAASLLQGVGLAGLMFILTVLIGAVFILAYKYVQKLSSGFGLQCRWRFCRTYILKSVPLLSISVAELISLRIDSVMLGVIDGAVEVGLYAGAYNVYLAGVLVPLAVTKVFFPRFVALYTSSGGRSAAFALMRQIRKYFLVYSVLAGVILFFAADYIVHLLFGEALSGAGDILMVLGLGLPLIALNRLYNYVLVGIRENGWYLRIAVTTALFNILLNLVLIPEYSVLGAAAATLLTEGLMLVLAQVRIMSRGMEQG